ncbi:hypothetical protein KIL84_011071, partial [Mauremys mutica]
RGFSPAPARAPPPPRVSPRPRANHGVQRGGRGRQRLAGGEGEGQEEAPGRVGHSLAHRLQHRHDRRVRAGERRGCSAIQRAGTAGRGGAGCGQ